MIWKCMLWYTKWNVAFSEIIFRKNVQIAEETSKLNFTTPTSRNATWSLANVTSAP